MNKTKAIATINLSDRFITPSITHDVYLVISVAQHCYYDASTSVLTINNRYVLTIKRRPQVHDIEFGAGDEKHGPGRAGQLRVARDAAVLHEGRSAQNPAGGQAI